MPAVDRPHNRGPEGERVHDLPPDAPWRLWGPYQSGRKWGTVPTGSGRVLNLAQAADELSDRLIGLFRGDAEHRRPSQPHDHPDDPLWNAHPRSASTSTATPVRDSARHTRPAGRRWLRT